MSNLALCDLTGKTALITGASGGIGGTIARALHEVGAAVALSGTRKAPLTELAADLGARAVVLPCDLSDVQAVEKLIGTTETVLGGCDILINNAGLTRDGLALRLKDSDWQTVLDVNLTAAFRLTRSVLRGMMKRRWGRIINISSVVGITGNAGQANYAAAKAGLIGMTKALALEVASRGITVNCVAPGFIQTAMTDQLSESQKEDLVKRIPAARLGKPEDVASAVLYLASEGGSYVTGQTMSVNGGMVMP